MIIVDVLMVLYRFNRAEVEKTLGALSLCSNEFRSIRVLVSGSAIDHRDFASIVHSASMAEQVLPTYRFDNLGFAAGNNHLLSQAFGSGGADYALLANPDLVISPGAISLLLSAATGTKPGLIGPALSWPSVPTRKNSVRRVDSLGCSWTRSRTALRHRPRQIVARNGRSTSPGSRTDRSLPARE